MILGANILVFVLVVSLGCVAVAWAWSFGPEIYDEQKIAWRVKHPKKEKADPEITVQLPVGSFDPDTTMSLPRVKKHELRSIFVIHKRLAARGRHARI